MGRNQRIRKERKLAEKAQALVSDKEAFSRKRLESKVRPTVNRLGFSEKSEGWSSKLKVSELVLKLAEPLLDKAHTQEEKKTLLELAVSAWNMATVPSTLRESVRQQMMDKYFPEEELHDEVLKVLDWLFKRKLQLLAKYEYYLVDFDLVFSKDEIDLSVASIPVQEYVERNNAPSS